MKNGKKKDLKPAFMTVRRTWTRRPVTSVRQSAKAEMARKKCRGRAKSGDDMCAVAA